MRRYVLNLQAGEQMPLPVSGVYVRIIRVISGAEGTISIKPDTSPELAGLEVGLGWTAEQPFNRLTFESATEQVVEVMAGFGRIDDGRANISGSIDSAITNTVDSFSKGATLTPSTQTIGTVAASIAAANAARRAITVKNRHAVSSIYIGDSGVTTANGMEVEAGQAITLNASAAAQVYAIGDTSNMNLRILEELN